MGRRINSSITRLGQSLARAAQRFAVREEAASTSEYAILLAIAVVMTIGSMYILGSPGLDFAAALRRHLADNPAQVVVGG